MARRRGMHLFALVAFLSLLAFLSAFVSAQRARDVRHRAAHLAAQLQDRDALGSAVAEATHAFMRDVNRPGSPLHVALREGTADLAVPIRLVHAHQGWAGAGKELSAEVRVLSRQPYADSDPTEWRGTLEVVARVRRADAQPAERTLSQLRELRAARAQAPAPFDRLDHLDWRQPPAGQPASPFDLEPAGWAARAALRVAGPDPERSFTDVSRTLPATSSRSSRTEISRSVEISKHPFCSRTRRGRRRRVA